MDAGQFQQALAAYDRALAIKFDANVATDRGVCFRELGQRERALTAFEFVTMKEPAHWQARYDKAVLLLEMQRYDDVQRELDVLVREHPDEPAVKDLLKAFTQKRVMPH
jgi:tetratricopeptide (TPR) repeat protein